MEAVELRAPQQVKAPHSSVDNNHNNQKLIIIVYLKAVGLCAYLATIVVLI